MQKVASHYYSLTQVVSYPCFFLHYHYLLLLLPLLCPFYPLYEGLFFAYVIVALAWVLGFPFAQTLHPYLKFLFEFLLAGALTLP